MSAFTSCAFMFRCGPLWAAGLLPEGVAVPSLPPPGARGVACAFVAACYLRCPPFSVGVPGVQGLGPEGKVRKWAWVWL